MAKNKEDGEKEVKNTKIQVQCYRLEQFRFHEYNREKYLEEKRITLNDFLKKYEKLQKQDFQYCFTEKRITEILTIA